MSRAAQVSLLRWLRRQLQQPTPAREHLEAAVENDDPSEVRRLLADVPLPNAAPSRRVRSTTWDKAAKPQRRLEQQLLDARVAVLRGVDGSESAALAQVRVGPCSSASFTSS